MEKKIIITEEQYKTLKNMGAYEYNCLMLDFKLPEIKKIQETIDKKDLYEPENSMYGFETEHHVTLLYGILPKVKWEDIKDYLLPLDNFVSIFPKMSIFEQDDFDVLKLEVKCPNMNLVNKRIVDNIEYESEFHDYKPHATIAYLKKGTAKKYIKPLNKIIEEKPYRYNYSVVSKDGDKNQFYTDKDL